MDRKEKVVIFLKVVKSPHQNERSGNDIEDPSQKSGTLDQMYTNLLCQMGTQVYLYVLIYTKYELTTL